VRSAIANVEAADAVHVEPDHLQRSLSRSSSAHGLVDLGLVTIVVSLTLWRRRRNEGSSGPEVAKRLVVCAVALSLTLLTITKLKNERRPCLLEAIG
jgi:hypothetical protein